MNLDQLIKDTTNLAMSIYAHQVPVWLKEIKELDDWNPDFELSEMHKDFQVLTRKAVLLSWLLGIDNAKREIEGNSKDFRDTLITNKAWETVGFDDALRKLAGKGIVDPATYKAMDANAKSIAWSIQRIENQNALLASKIHLKNCIDGGLSLNDFKKQMSGVYEAYGITPLTPHHIDTVYRTNLGSVYNTAKYETFMEDENVVYLQYVAVEDYRLIDHCKSFANNIYRKDDPIIQIIGPLNHYQCRCYWLPITKGYAQANNVRASKKPNKKAIDGIHKDFNKKPKSVAEFQDILRDILEEKVKANKEIIEEIKKVFVSARSIKEAKKSIPAEITEEGK